LLGTGAFNFSANNGFGTQTITTTAAGTPVNGTAQVLSSVGAATTITETLTSDYFVSAMSCTGLGNGSASYNFALGTITLDSAATVAGNNITCAITNTRAIPALQIEKTPDRTTPVVVGDVITYEFRITNSGNVPITNVMVSDVHHGLGPDPVPGNEILLIDNNALGDSSDSTSNGVWDSLGPGDVIKFHSNYTVTQADFDAPH
jgi:hypothetical protein